MKILNYNLELNSSSTHQTEEREQTNLKVWVDDSKESIKQKQLTNGIVLTLSDEGKKLATQATNIKEADEIYSLEKTSEEIPDEADLKQKLLYQFIYILTGKRIKFVNIKLQDINKSSMDLLGVSGQSPKRVGWGIDFNYQSSYTEESRVSFSANGVVKTTDGREINLKFNMNMSRTFYSQTSISFKAGDTPIDPLIINLGNTLPSLSSKKLSFDINIDGNKENISLPTSSSGFLVLDKNKNGNIDDGGELFGPQTGNGFDELSKYDTDSNGWIDENDPIYNNLQIWQHDDSGNSSLIALGKAGVGAIYLENAQTDFRYVDNQNDTQGILRQTSIFLRENGTAGTVQHIDLMI
jgi:hypothetical protein